MENIPLVHVCDFQGGSQPPKDQWVNHEKDGYIRMLQIRDFTQPDKDNVEYVRITKSIKTCNEDDILIGRYGASVGKILTGLAGAYNVAIVKTIPDVMRLSKRFLYHYLNSPYFQNFILSVGSRAAQAGFNKDDLSDAIIPLLSLDEQNKVVIELDKVDMLINLRKEQLAKLDQLIKARFAEVISGGNYQKEPLGENVLEMFIGPFGSSLKNEYFVEKSEGFCMVYEQKHAIQKTMDVPTRYVAKSKYDELRRFTVMGGDIIVSCRGTIGEIFIVPNDAPMGIMHPSIMKIRLNAERYNQRFFVMALEQYMNDHNAEAKGSGVKMAVSATVLSQTEFIVPPMDVQNDFASFVEQTNKTKLTIQASLDKLEVMKKALMQEYFG